MNLDTFIYRFRFCEDMSLINISAWKNTDIPLGNLYYRLIENSPVDVFTGILTMQSPAERLHLYRLACGLPTGSQIVEIGAYAGGSTYFLGKGAEKIAGKVISVDPFSTALERQISEADNSRYFRKMPFKPTIHSVRTSLNRAGINGQVKLVEGFAEDVARTWSGQPINMLWIDGNHNNARKDYDAWVPHLAQGAVVAFHDANFPIKGKEVVTVDVMRLLTQIKYNNLQKVGSIVSFNME